MGISWCGKLFLIVFLWELSIRWLLVVGANIDYMTRHCDGTILLYRERRQSIVLHLTPDAQYDPFMNCVTQVITEPDHRIAIKFEYFDIQSYKKCPGDFLHVFDGPLKYTEMQHATFQSINNWKLCGTSTPPSMTSSSSNMTLWFVSNANVEGKGFMLLITSFRDGPCEEEEFQCNNGRCISDGLECDENDDCGDGSGETFTECVFPVHVIIGLSVTAFLLLLAGSFLVAVMAYRCRRKHEELEEEIDNESVITCDCVPSELVVASLQMAVSTNDTNLRPSFLTAGRYQLPSEISSYNGAWP